MGKRRGALSTAQLGFSFEPPVFEHREAELAGLDRQVSAAVACALKEDSRSRVVVAAAMSALLGEDVTAYMVDGYASEARENHNIPFHRAAALFAATQRFDLLDHLLRRIGVSLLVGEEMMTAELGHIDRQIDALRARRKRLQTSAKPILRGTKE